MLGTDWRTTNQFQLTTIFWSSFRHTDNLTRTLIKLNGRSFFRARTFFLLLCVNLIKYSYIHNYHHPITYIHWCRCILIIISVVIDVPCHQCPRRTTRIILQQSQPFFVILKALNYPIADLDATFHPASTTYLVEYNFSPIWNLQQFDRRPQRIWVSS